MTSLTNTLFIFFIASLCISFCMADDDLCADFECGPGTCTVNNKTATCVCPTGLTGEHCEQDLCADFECGPGTCTVNNKTATCVCPTGLTGEHCEQDPCAAFVCGPGTCKVDSTTATCVCPTGWTGDHCETEPGCETLDCTIGGFCVYLDIADFTNVTCVCKDNYKGWNCSEKIEDGCESLTCENGACLYQDKTDFTKVVCQCNDGYTGDTCEKEVPHPSNNDAKKGGQSFDAASFIGGIVLAVGLIIIGVVAFKFYRRKKEPASRYSQF